MSKEEQVEPIKKYYIAYFDLLGYKAFLKSHSDKAESFLTDINNAIQNTKKYIQGIALSFLGGNLTQMSIKVKIFSDNILLCLETGTTQMEYPRFLAFLMIVADIQRNFILQHDLFLRGGITIGMLSFNNDFVFGQGLIDAVDLEEKAVYPRIIIGAAAMDYILQPHFVKSEDLERACEIERCANITKEVSDEELAFCNDILPMVNVEKFYLKWRECLVLRIADDVAVLNYLYCLDMNKVVDPAIQEQVLEFMKEVSPDVYQRVRDGLDGLDPKSILEKHKFHTIQKINKWGKYDDLSASAVEEARQREHILKKYLWVSLFHNYVCIGYDLQECMIKSGSTCDIRFMRLVVSVFEDDQPVSSQEE